MLGLNTSSRLSLVAALSTALVPAGFALANDNPSGSYDQSDASRIVSTLKSSNCSLADAIKMAEDKANGTAVSARAMTKGMDGSSLPAVDVTVLDRSGNLKCVMVDIANKKVLGVHDYAEAMRSTGNDWSDKSRAYGKDPSSLGSAWRQKPLRADEIIGKNFTDAQGETIGEIEDLAIDPQIGRVVYVVVSTGGTLGMGEKYHAVPWTALHEHGKTFSINLTKENFENSPTFEKSNWPNWNDVSWNQGIYSHYNAQVYWERPSRLRGSEYGSVRSNFRPQIYRASEVIGMDVNNLSNEDLGEINGLIIDPDSGDVRYAVVGVGGFIGIGEKDVAVPWTAFGYNADKKALTLDADKDRLKGSPEVKRNSWPDWNDQTWEERMYKQYPPYHHDHAEDLNRRRTGS